MGGRLGGASYSHGRGSYRECGGVPREERADVGVGSQSHVDDVEAATGQPRRLELVDHAGRGLVQPADVLRSGQPVHLRLPYSGGNEWRGQHVVALRVPLGNEALVSEPQVNGMAQLLGLGNDERGQRVGQRHTTGASRQRQVGHPPVRNRLGQDPHGVLAGLLSRIVQGRCDDDGRCRSRSRGHLDLGERLAVGGVVIHSRAPPAAWPGPPDRRGPG